MKYAMLIRKTDLALLTILNNGVTPKIEKGRTYLIIDTDGPNDIVTERGLNQLYDIRKNSPFLFGIKK